MFSGHDYNTTETVIIPFNTFTSDDPSASVTITNLAASDVEIHKDGSTTQRASDNGVTVSIDFDGVTGNHLISIDLSDNSDAGYYANGSRIQVRMEGTTIDGATVNAWIGAFSIGCTLRPTTVGRTLDVDASGDVTTDAASRTASKATGFTTLANMGIAQGSVVADGSNSTTVFKTDLTYTSDQGYENATLLFTNGDLEDEHVCITGFSGSDKFVTVSPALSAIPAADDDFLVMPDFVERMVGTANASTHNAAGVWSAGTRTLTAFGFTPTVNLTKIEGHSLAGTGTRIADGFEYWFNVATPAKTMNDAGVAGSGLTAGQVWAYANNAPTVNTMGHYLTSIDAVLGGVTNTSTVNEVGFENRAGTEIRRLTFGSDDGSRTASVIS